MTEYGPTVTAATTFREMIQTAMPHHVIHMEIDLSIPVAVSYYAVDRAGSRSAVHRVEVSEIMGAFAEDKPERAA